MATPDPALGFDVDFDKEAFENGIRFSMQMGAPNDLDRQAVFIKKSTTVRYFLGSTEVFPGADLRTDRDGKPLNPDVRMEAGTDQEIPVDCAIEITKADADELPVGDFRPTKATVTVLDSDYLDIEGCQEMRYNADRYLFGYEPEADGMFDSGVHQLVFYAVDDS